MNRWAFLTALAMAAVAALAIYTWGWRDRESTSTRDERATADAYSRVIAYRSGGFASIHLERLAPRVWEMRFLDTNGACKVAAIVQLDEFRPTANKDTAGVGQIRC